MTRPRLSRERVLQINKLLWLVLLLAFAYVFVSGLLTGPAGTDDTATTPRLDLSHIAAGDYRFMEVNGRLLLVLHRTAGMLRQLQPDNPELGDPQSQHSRQPATFSKTYRSQFPEYLVVLAQDPGSGCQLTVVKGNNDDGDIRDLCSGSRYDWAGRALAPAQVNLAVPDYDLSAQLKADAKNPPRP